MASNRDARGAEAPTAAGGVAVVDRSAAASEHVFVSFASTDREVADSLVASLEAGDVRCWIAHRDIQPAGSYPAAISAAVSACGALLLVLTSAAGRSRHVLREMEMAFNAGKPILAIRLGGAPLRADFEYFLSTTQWLDAGEDLDEAEIGHVRRRLREMIAGPAAEDERGSGAPARSKTAALYRLMAILGAGPRLSRHFDRHGGDRSRVLPGARKLRDGGGHGDGRRSVDRTLQHPRAVHGRLPATDPDLPAGDPQSSAAGATRAPRGPSRLDRCVVAAGGAVMTLRHGLPDASVLSLAGWRAWFAPTWSLLRKVEKLETAFKVLAVLTGVLGWLLRLF